LYDEISISGITSLGIFLRLINYFIQVSFRIRLLAIVDFGTVIHEFDPYFNFRATEVSEYIYVV
jgi:asparagine N-glycosylation enzyme membrane subunit Stt3